MKTIDSGKEVTLTGVPPQENKQECQHVSNGACIKCRFPMTWRKFIAS